MADRVSFLSPPPDPIARIMREELWNNKAQRSIDTSSEQVLIGIGLGPIDPKYLTREAWSLQGAEALTQYRKFIQLMINRIRGGESNKNETERFTYIFERPAHWTWMIPALGMLPELEEHGPLPQNEQMLQLLQHVQKILEVKHQQRVGKLQRQQQRGQVKSSVAAGVVSGEVRDRLAKLLFGPDGGANASPAMKRLLDSWSELGYPSEVIQQAIDNQEGCGKALSRDSLGLPSELTKEHLFHLHKSEARRKSAPGSIGSRRPSPSSSMPIKKASLDESDEDVSTDEQWDRTRKTLRRQLPPTASNPEPDFTDRPPESLINEFENCTTIDSNAPADAMPRLPVQKASFWHFERTRAHDYDKYIAPLTKEDRAIHQAGWRHPITPISTRTTKEGTLVVKGFDKPSPETSDAILKEVDDAAANWSQNSTSDSSPELGVISGGDTSSSEEARRKNRATRKEQMARLDELSDSEPIAGTGHAATMPNATAASWGLTSSGYSDPSTTSDHPPISMRSAYESGRVEKVNEQLESPGIPLQPLDPQQVRPSDEVERVAREPKTEEVEVHDRKLELRKKPEVDDTAED